MLPKLRRLVPSMPRHQRGLVARLMRLAMVGLGGAERPFLMSLWRWPRICKSSVSCSAEQLAALARSMRRLMKSRSRITYTWNQNGWRPVCSAMSSMEQMLMVDSVNGMPNALAAPRPEFSIGVLHPCQARGRNRHRHGHVLPHHGGAGGTAFHVHRHALAQLDALEVLSLER